MSIVKTEKKKLYFEWLARVDDKKPKRSVIVKELGIHKNTAINWTNEYNRQGAVSVMDEGERKKKIEDMLFNLAMTGKTTPAEILARMKGWNAPDKVLTISLTMDDYDRIRKAAEAKRTEFRRSLGDSGVSGRPDLLSGEVREDKRCDPQEDGAVAAVAVPDKSD